MLPQSIDADPDQIAWILLPVPNRSGIAGCTNVDQIQQIIEFQNSQIISLMQNQRKNRILLTNTANGLAGYRDTTFAALHKCKDEERSPPGATPTTRKTHRS